MRNEVTKFGANPTTFESLIADLKITNFSVAKVRQISCFFASHVVVCVLYSRLLCIAAAVALFSEDVD